MTQLLPYTPPASGGLRPPHPRACLNVFISRTTFKYLATALMMQKRQETEVTKLSQNNPFFFFQCIHSLLGCCLVS